MDSLEFLTIGQIADVIHASRKSMQNAIKADPANPARGSLQLAHASIPLARLGRAWLARRSDISALFDSIPTQPAQAAPAAPRRSPGRPRESHTAQIGGVK